MGFHDLAANAEILQHAFERARIGFQLGLAERLAIAGLWCRQHRHRGQLELVGGFFPWRRLLARRAGGRSLLLVVLVLFDLVVLFRGFRDHGWRRTAAEARLLSLEGGSSPRLRPARDQRAIGGGEKPAEPRLRAHQRMEQQAERDRAAILFLFRERLVVVLDRRQLLVRARARPSRRRTGMSRSSRPTG